MPFSDLALRFLAAASGSVVFGSLALAQPTIQSVLNGASYDRIVAPGSAVSIFGSRLAPSTARADSLPLPLSLAGVAVSIDGVEAPLYYVSATQINLLIPYEINPGKASLIVTTPAGQSSAYRLDLVPAAPGIFTLDASGEGRPLLLDQNFQIRDSVIPGERLILYLTGLGATEPSAITGAGGATSEPFNRVTEMPDVYIGGQAAVVEFAGVAPGLAGVYQLNVVVPGQFASDKIVVLAAGHLSQRLDVAVTVPGPITGSDITATESREIEDFRRVQVLTVADVEIRVGTPTSLKVTVDDNVLPLITTVVSNGALKIGTTRQFKLDEGGVRVEVTTPVLDRVTLIGVGNISATGITGERFGATMSAVGNVTGSGQVQFVDVLMRGVGNVSLFGLSAQEARAWCSGVGSAEVDASDFLFARVFGLCSVVYSGNPAQTDVEVVGLGSITPQ
jgi:uncharacterized protein (TIGR03437 family)